MIGVDEAIPCAKLLLKFELYSHAHTYELTFDRETIINSVSIAKI